MKELFPSISICVILIVLNGISDSLCNSVFGGVIQETPTKELDQDFKDLQRMMAESKEWKRMAPNITISLNVRQCPCSRKSIIMNTLDLWFDTWSTESVGLDFVLIGDCMPACLLFSFYGFMRTPTLVNGCRAEYFNNLQVFPFMIRLTGAWRKMAQPFYEFMKAFEWRNVAIISSYRDLINTGAMEIRRFLQARGMTVHSLQIDYYDSLTEPHDLKRMKEVAKYAKGKTGILLLMLSQDDRMLFLRVAKDLDMLDGSYAFLTIYNFDNSSKEAMELQEGLIFLDATDAATTAFDPHVLDGIQLYLRAKQQNDDPETIMTLMRHDAFNGSSGVVMFDGDGLRLERYVLQNIRNGKPVNVMHLSYDTAIQAMKVDYVALSQMVWPGRTSITPDDTIRTKWMIPAYLKIYVPLIVLGNVIFILFFIWAYRELRYRLLLKASAKWIIDWKDLQFADSNKIYDDAASLTSKRVSYTAERRSQRGRASELSYIDAIYANNTVLVQALLCSSINLKNRNILNEMNLTMSLSHENIVRYLGICPFEPNVAIVMSVAKRGSLQDIIMRSDQGALTLDFVVSLLIDAAKGMQYLHSTELGSHGHLTSAKCVIDSRWTCMVAGCGFRRLKRCRVKDIPESERDDYYFRELLWTAPEILRHSVEKRPIYGTKEGDVYSFAIICQEAVYSDIPYAKESTLMQFRDIVNEVAKKSLTPFRPSLIDADCSREFLEFIRSCWQEVPSKRPSFHKIILELQKLFESSGDSHTGMMEKLMIRTEKHALNLADQVEEATAELIAEKKKADNLLSALLPRYVAEILESGRTFEPQEYESISMCFADIVEFTKICAASTPMQVVQLLSSIYSQYDDITDAHKAYKIETIGDCYVVASGVPVRNGQRHATDIADLALHFLRTIETFTIPYLNGVPLLTRIGVHTGPAVAGVVGVKVPRLNVFGLTVIIASKLESTGSRNKIHISSSTASILKATKRYILQYRGEREITRGNFVKTYYLIGYKRKSSKAESRRSRQGSLVKQREQRKSSAKEELPAMVQKAEDLTTTTTETDVLKKADDIWKGIYNRIVTDLDRTAPLLRRTRTTLDENLPSAELKSRMTVSGTSDASTAVAPATAAAIAPTTADATPAPTTATADATPAHATAAAHATPAAAAALTSSPYRRPMRRMSIGRQSIDRGVSGDILVKTPLNRTSETDHETSFTK